ncbi:MAG TPA: hypothetical protein VIK01_26810 [Polyangiaceae bacterium]
MLRDLARWVSALHGDGRARLARYEPVAEIGVLGFREPLFDAVRLEARRVDRYSIHGRRQRPCIEAPVGVGRALYEQPRAEPHFYAGPGERALCAGQAHAPVEPAFGLDFAAYAGRRLKMERIPVQNAALHRLVVARRGAKHELERRALRRLIEAVPRRFLDRRAGDPTQFVDIEQQHDIPLDVLLGGLGGIRHLFEMRQLRWRDRLRFGGLLERARSVVRARDAGPRCAQHESRC